MKKLISLILAGIIAAGSAMAVSAEDAVPERAKGVAFKAESRYYASTYTGYASGIEVDKGLTVSSVLVWLENSNGVEIRRDGNVLKGDEKVKHGDKIVLTAEDGSVKSEFTIIFMGDANKDNKLNLSDVSAMLKKIAKWDVSINEIAADVNGDGVLNISDVSTFMKATAGWKDSKFVKDPVLPGKATMVKKADILSHSGVGTDGWTALNLNSNEEEGTFDDIAVKFTVGEGEYLTNATALCPSWDDSKGSVTISVYKWNGDYASTVSAMPIYTNVYEDFADNSLVDMSLVDTTGKGLVEGEYLWRIHDGIDAKGGGAGLWCYLGKKPAESTKMEAFLDGEAFDIGPVVVFSFASAK